MEQTLATPRIKKFRKEIEKALNVKITFSYDTASISGDSFDEYKAIAIVDALNLGFELATVLQLKNEDYMFAKINLKQVVKRSRLSTVRGRVIGLQGKTKHLISELSECEIAVKDNIVGIIGKTEDVDIALRAITSLIQGSPHSSIYAFLEKGRKIRKDRIEDI